MALDIDYNSDNWEVGTWIHRCDLTIKSDTVEHFNASNVFKQSYKALQTIQKLFFSSVSHHIGEARLHYKLHPVASQLKCYACYAPLAAASPRLNWGKPLWKGECGGGGVPSFAKGGTGRGRACQVWQKRHTLTHHHLTPVSADFQQAHAQAGEQCIFRLWWLLTQL